VIFDNPPLNLMGPEFVLEFREIMAAIETDEQVKVVVFESAVEGFYLNHSDFHAKLEDLTSIPQGPTGLEAWPDILVRLTRAPVASIAVIRGRATGNGSEIALACDMSFASREKAVLSQWEVGSPRRWRRAHGTTTKIIEEASGAGRFTRVGRRYWRRYRPTVRAREPSVVVPTSLGSRAMGPPPATRPTPLPTATEQPSPGFAKLMSQRVRSRCRFPSRASYHSN